MHEDELPIDENLVRRLLERDLPELSGLELTRMSRTGSSNVLFRLGEQLVVRLPRQPGGSATIDKEARYLPLIARHLSVPVPEIVAVGRPGCGYPERWSLVRWLDGARPNVPARPGETTAELALELAALVREMRDLEVPDHALADPTLRWYRSGPISAIAEDIRSYLDECRSIPDLPLSLDGCDRFWSVATRLPEPPETRPHWIHADLLAENLLVRHGRLAAVLDFGGLALGDTCVDLIVAWEVLGPDERMIFRSAVGVDELAWQHGRAWAFALGIMTFPYYWHTMPERCADRLAMVRAVLADAADE